MLSLKCAGKSFDLVILPLCLPHRVHFKVMWFYQICESLVPRHELQFLLTALHLPFLPTSNTASLLYMFSHCI